MLEYTRTNEFVDAKFRMVDLQGATFRECDLRKVRMVNCGIDELYISGWAGEMGRVVINDVDVTAYVTAELNKRHPERVQLEAMSSADDLRATWATIEGLWSETEAHAGELPEELLNERVDGEWSFIETLRHLVFATDLWVDQMVRGVGPPSHPLGLPPEEDTAARTMDRDARPAYAEVVALHADRMAKMRAVLADITEAELDETRTGVLSSEWGEESFPVRDCLSVVMRESVEHRRYALRDLAVLEARSGPLEG